MGESLRSEGGPLDDAILKTLFQSPELKPETFDTTIHPDQNKLQIVYFWGENCPNCVIAKRHLKEMAEDLKALPVDFHSVNAYEHTELATRFGLYGIPAFFFFRKGRPIGRVTSFPGKEEFLGAIRRSL